MKVLTTSGACAAAAAAVLAQVILPAALDLIASAAIFACGAVAGWNSAKS